ncbi:MAG: gas vesicle protein GvpO [Candidatus Nanopelagicales bacterium]|nr:gas vesicle protein GvpO [Candidatus Nanopelagicales bacterium]MDZ7578945.1 gas vesicle protein GvpO [Candidatus Nanopelagicales bacterium]
MMDIVKKAREELGVITGSVVEKVSGLEPTDDGWSMRIELIEVQRVPDTQDLLGMYEVQLDAKGGLKSFERVALRVRGGMAGEEQ